MGLSALGYPSRKCSDQRTQFDYGAVQLCGFNFEGRFQAEAVVLSPIVGDCPASR